MGKVHGSLARAGKVKSQTPKVEKKVKPRVPKGRAYKRVLFVRRYVHPEKYCRYKRKSGPVPTTTNTNTNTSAPEAAK